MTGEKAKHVDHARIVAARQTRRMTRAELSQELGISSSFLSNIELGYRSGEPYVEAIADVTRFPIGYFWRRSLTIPKSDSFAYRRRARMKSLDKLAIEGLCAINACDPADTIKNYVRVPDVRVPNLSDLAEVGTPLEVGESVSSLMRAKFGMGNSPLGHAIDLVESMGIIVLWIDGPLDFDGVSFWVNESPFILLNRNQLDGYRMRLTVLHELLHLLCHRSVPKIEKEHDQQANAFASAMLMPAATFGRVASKRFDAHLMLDERPTWGASVAAMVRRCHDLRIYSDWVYRDANIRLTNLKWRFGEPRAMAVENSTVHQFFFEEAGDQGKYAFDLAQEADQPYDLFLASFPIAVKYEKSANAMPAFG